MFSKGSRYENIETLQITLANGRVLNYKAIRFIPVTKAQMTHLLSQGDRLDHLAFRYYRDAERFWRIADANLAAWPDDLTAEFGVRILIPPSS